MSTDTPDPKAAFEIVAEVTRILEPLSEEDRAHVMNTVAVWYRIPGFKSPLNQTTQTRNVGSSAPTDADVNDPFQGREEISPKQFIMEKDPRTEAERIACLAYYLTHFRDTPAFGTNDLSRLNTEAAQRKFSNAAVTAGNAMRDGLFVQASKPGLRQLSAIGERFVQALPDRDGAKNIKQRMRVSRGRRNGTSKENDAVVRAER